MSQQISLKDAERKAFRTTYNHGLWDVFLGCCFLSFVISLYLSSSLGDLWSMVVYVALLGGVLLVIQLLRKSVVAPRVGIVEFSPARKTKLAKLTFLMLVVNIVAFILALVAAINFRNVPGQMLSIILGLILLIGFSSAAYFLDFKRLFLYGLLVGISPVVGESLWIHGYATHHGFPITFGTSAGFMILVGVALLVRFLRENHVLKEGVPSEEA